MKKLYFLFLIFIFSFSLLNCSAQNLVPNPSFEDTVSCPNDIMETYKAKYWVINVNSADYFNSCAGTSNEVSVPKNSFGYQIPATGKAYCGEYFYVKSTMGDVREYLGARLLSPLIPNQKYYGSFKVSWADGLCATNKLGILFTNSYYGDSTTWGAVVVPPPLINNLAQVYTNSLITDSVNWTTISGSFIADSAYKYIYIGNFFSRTNTDTLWFNGYSGGLPDCKSYYYIDDICVSTDSATCVKLTGIKDSFLKSPFIIFPNPAMESFTIKTNLINLQKIDITIYNSFGEIMKQFLNEQVNAVFDVSQYSKGIYYVKLLIPNNIFYHKLIIY